MASSNKIDRNASSPNRVRRNWQRMVKGGVSITATAPLSYVNGNISLTLNANGGLQNSTGLSLKLADTSLVLSSSGAAVNLATNSGLQISSGLKVKTVATGGLLLDGSGAFYINSFQKIAADPGSPAAGDAWYNTTTNQNRSLLATDGTNTLIGTLEYTIFQSGSQGTVNANTTPQTIPFYTQTLPTNFLTPGHSLRWTLNGFINGTVSETFTFNMMFNSTVIGTLSMPFIAPGNTFFSLIIDVNSSGAGGGISVLTGFGSLGAAGVVIPVTATAVTVSGTVTWSFTATATSTTASTQFNIIGATVELLI